MAGILRFAFLAVSLLASYGRSEGQYCPVEVPIDRKVYKGDWIPTSSDLKGKVRSVNEYELYSKSLEAPKKIEDHVFRVCNFRAFDQSGRLVLEYRRYSGRGRSPQSMRRYLYDEDGNGYTNVEYAYNDSSRLDKARKVTFDGLGRVKGIVRQEVAGSYWEDLHYAYSGNGLQLPRGKSSSGLEWKSRYWPDQNAVVEYRYRTGTFRDSTIFEYDAQGCLIRREAQPRGSFPGSAYEMSFRGDTVFERFSMPTDRLVSLDVYYRDGRLLESSEYYESGKTESRVEYTYDEAGNLIKEWDQVKNRGKKISYEYDRRGNWILKRVREKSTSRIVKVYYREIEYFD